LSHQSDKITSTEWFEASIKALQNGLDASSELLAAKNKELAAEKKLRAEAEAKIIESDETYNSIDLYICGFVGWLGGFMVGIAVLALITGG
jgi:hypothetical protein